MAAPKLFRASWLAIATHLVAGLAMAIVLRHGLDSNSDLTSRLRFLVDHRTAWTVAWLSWNVAALSIAYFFVEFFRAHDRRLGSMQSRWLRVAVFVGTVAIIPDLTAEAIEMSWIPTLAEDVLRDSTPTLADERATTSLERFVSVRRGVVILTGVLANALYTLAVVINALATRSRHPRWVTGCGLAVGLFGGLASAAGTANSVPGLIAANAILVPAILAWLAGVAWTNRLGLEPSA